MYIKITEIKLILLKTIKRFLDLTLSLLILLLLFPILILSALLLLIFEGRPITYISPRMCSKDKVIEIYKFRTMVKDAKSSKYKLNERFMREGFLDIPLSCEVYTPIGRFLERTQIVELLQLFNIIKNDMSFVGNRPLPIQNIELLKQYSGWEKRFCSPAGICGISQIVGKFNLSASERLSLEAMYSSIYNNPKGNIVLCDLIIIFYTARLLLCGKYIDFDKGVSLMLACGGNALETTEK